MTDRRKLWGATLRHVTTSLLALGRLSFVSRIVLTSISTMIIGFFASLALIQRIIKTTVYNEIDERVRVAQNTLRYLAGSPGSAAIVKETLQFGSTATDMNQLVNLAKAIGGADATIFIIAQGRPIRVATTIMKASGSELNVGTELLGPARAAFEAGQNFIGVSPVAGRNFINRYEIICDAAQRPVGILYSGIPLTRMYDAQAKIMRTVFASSIWAPAVCACAMWLVTQPLRQLFENAVAVAHGLAQGDVSQVTGAISSDEIGDFNSAFREMIGYQQRMAAVADAIADGDLTMQIAPVASTDRLGIAFSRMQANLRSLVDQLAALALTDGLTQIGNVRAFQEAIRVEVSRAGRAHQPVSLVMVDVDKFKQINDLHGHQHGDAVLVRLAALLRTLRIQDCAYRIGGDEFAIILASTSVDEAKIAMERICSQAPERLFGATVSIGLATSDGEIDPAILQRRADIALYAGKRRGRAKVVAFSEADALEFGRSAKEFSALRQVNPTVN